MRLPTRELGGGSQRGVECIAALLQHPQPRGDASSWLVAMMPLRASAAERVARGVGCRTIAGRLRAERVGGPRTSYTRVTTISATTSRIATSASALLEKSKSIMVSRPFTVLDGTPPDEVYVSSICRTFRAGDVALARARRHPRFLHFYFELMHFPIERLR
jgi:hypothetical protein